MVAATDRGVFAVGLFESEVVLSEGRADALRATAADMGIWAGWWSSEGDLLGGRVLFELSDVGMWGVSGAVAGLADGDVIVALSHSSDLVDPETGWVASRFAVQRMGPDGDTRWQIAVDTAGVHGIAATESGVVLAGVSTGRLAMDGEHIPVGNGQRAWALGLDPDGQLAYSWVAGGQSDATAVHPLGDGVAIVLSAYGSGEPIPLPGGFRIPSGWEIPRSIAALDGGGRPRWVVTDTPAEAAPWEGGLLLSGLDDRGPRTTWLSAEGALEDHRVLVDGLPQTPVANDRVHLHGTFVASVFDPEGDSPLTLTLPEPAYAVATFDEDLAPRCVMGVARNTRAVVADPAASHYFVGGDWWAGEVPALDRFGDDPWVSAPASHPRAFLARFR